MINKPAGPEERGRVLFFMLELKLLLFCGKNLLYNAEHISHRWAYITYQLVWKPRLPR